MKNSDRKSTAIKLIIANKELAFQNSEKEKRAAELIIANKELAFQNSEKEKRAVELIIANEELAFQTTEKGKRADELIIANKELAFQNSEKEKRAAELIIINKELERLKEQTKIEAKKYSELYDYAPSGYFTLSNDGKISELNLAGSQMLGKERVQLKNAYFRSFVSDDTRSDFKAFLEKIFITKIKENCDVALTTNDNTPLYVHLTGIVSENSEQSYVTVVDITVRKNAEMQLHSTTERLHLATSSAKAGVWDWNLLTNEMNWDDRMCELYGVTRENFSGGITAWEKGLHPDDASRAVEECQRAIRGEQEFDTEFRIKRPNGEVVHIKANGLVIRDENAKPVRMIGLNTDITDRKQVEDALRKSEERYRLLANNVPDIIYSLDSEGNIITVNNSAFERFGYTEQESIGRPFLNFIHPEDRDIVINSFSKAREERRKFTQGLQFRIVAENGVSYWFELNSHANFDSQKRYTGEDGVLREITSRKNTEKALREAEEKFRILNTLAPAGIYLTDPDGMCLYTNPKWNEMAGLNHQEALGKGWINGIHPDDREFVFSQWKKMVESDGQWGVEYRFQTSEGKTTWVYGLAIPQKNSAGQTILYVGLNMDITERKHAEELVKSNELKFRTLADFTYDWEYWKKEDGQIVYMSPSCERITGYTQNEFISDPSLIERIICPEDSASMLQHTRKVHTINHREEISEAEFGILHKNGSIVYIHHICRPIFNENKNYLGRRVSNRDITERKKSEEALRLAAKLESIGTLAGGIAHDFNNLLNAVMGQSSLALKKLSPDNPAISHITKAMNASERAAILTRQLLAYSGKGKFYIKEIDLNLLVKENINLLEVSVSKSAELRFELVSPSPCITGDVAQIQQVVMNLIINASDAIETNPGVIDVRTSRIELTEKDDEYWRFTNMPLAAGSYALFQVTDTGCGISQDALTRIFDPFFSTKFTGRGLGLSAVLGIIKGHKGGLRIESTVGIGTIFEIVFPLAGTSTITTVPAKREKQIVNGKGKRILIVDDDPFVFQLLEDALKEVNFTVIGESDPVKGIELYRREHQNIAMVILDYSMPHMNGKDAFEKLLEINRDVKVILCSGYNEEETLSTFQAEQPLGFFQKPYNMEAIVGMMAEILLEK